MPKIVLQDYFADWCQPCKLLAPTIEDLEKKYSSVKFERINVETQPEKASEMGVMGLPTIIILKDGKEVFRSAGTVSKEKIEEVLKK